jgi:predicted dehydrogenase
MEKIRFGIIGCGLISDWHAKAIGQIPNAVLVGVADINKASADAVAQKYNILSFRTVEELLESDNIDTVCICTPSGLHVQLAVKAADAGKHIVIEKPMAITTEQCAQIIAAVERNHVKAAVVSQFRFSEAVKELKKAIATGSLGKIVMGSIYMKYYRSYEYYNKNSWKGTWKMDGGGALMNQGIHGIDMLQYVMGKVKSVSALTRTLVHKIEVEDTACAVVEYESGSIGIIQGTTSVYPGFPRRLEVNGEKGSIVVEEDAIVEWVVEGETLPEHITLQRAENVGSSDPANISVEGHIRQLADMTDAILKNRRPMVDIYEGRKAVEIIEAIYESSRTGKTIYLK